MRRRTISSPIYTCVYDFGGQCRLVNVYMNQYFCPAAIEEPNFLLSELKEYYVPPDGDLQSYKVCDATLYCARSRYIRVCTSHESVKLLRFLRRPILKPGQQAQ